MAFLDGVKNTLAPTTLSSKRILVRFDEIPISFLSVDGDHRWQGRFGIRFESTGRTLELETLTDYLSGFGAHQVREEELIARIADDIVSTISPSTLEVTLQIGHGVTDVCKTVTAIR